MESATIAWINVTEQCNNRCLYCYAKDSLHDRRKIIPTETVLGIIDKLIMLHTSRCILIGGEPTLHPDIMRIYQYGLDHGITMGMVTNGSRFADEDFCKSFVKAGLSKGSITLSMHASSDEDSAELTRSTTYYSLFKRGLKNLLDLKVKPGINITITTANQSKIALMMDTLKNMGIETVHFNLGGPSVSLEGVDAKYMLTFSQLASMAESIYLYGKRIKLKTRFLFLAPFCILPKKLYDLMDKEDLIDSGCSIRTGMGMAFNVDANVVTCNHLLDFPVIKKAQFLTVKNAKQYRSLWESKNMKDMRKSVMVYRRRECKNCSEFRECQGGGCPLFWLNKVSHTNCYQW